MDTISLKLFSSVVRELRGNTPQRDFAEILGVSQSTINNWENAKGGPNLDNLARIAEMRDELPEELLAYLYGRICISAEVQAAPPEELLKGSSIPRLADFAEALAYEMRERYISLRQEENGGNGENSIPSPKKPTQPLEATQEKKNTSPKSRKNG